MKLRDLYWSDDDTLLFTAECHPMPIGDSSIDVRVLAIFAAELGSGKVRTLLDEQSDQTYVTGTNLLAAHTTKPATVIV